MVYSGYTQHSPHIEEHPNPSKEHGIYEIISTGIYAYSFAEEAGSPATELHFTYWFTHTYGTGISYTLKFGEEETLHDLALLGSWNPTRWLTLNMGPNFALPSDHRSFHLLLYTEAEINIRLTEWFHLGPVLGSLLGEESEISGGMHIGFEF